MPNIVDFIEGKPDEFQTFSPTYDVTLKFIKIIFMNSPNIVEPNFNVSKCINNIIV